MIKIRYIYLFVAALGMLAGCSDYLDIVPKGKVIPEHTQDFRLLLDQVESRGQSNGFLSSYGADLFVADDLKITPFSESFYGASAQNALTFAEHIYLDFELDPDWDALYNQIYVCNLVVDQVMESDGGSQAEREALRAEARVHRAYAYLILVNLYAKHYNPATAATDLGVPLRLGTDFEESLSRATVQGIYTFVLEELENALPFLPAAPVEQRNHRPSVAAAEALLAKTYLYMGRYTEAQLHAGESLDRYQVLLDYNTLPPSMMVPGTAQHPDRLENPEILLAKSVTDATSLFYGSDGLMALFDMQDDLRVTTNFMSDALFGLSFGFISTEWTGRQPAKGPSTPEVLLIRAESRARLDNVEGALSDLNLLRSYRYKSGSDYALTATTPAEALQLVKEERRRELAFKGTRLFDLKRYAVFDGETTTIEHELGGQHYTLASDAPRIVLPIGRKYIALNPEIEQNAR